MKNLLSVLYRAENHLVETGRLLRELKEAKVDESFRQRLEIALHRVSELDVQASQARLELFEMFIQIGSLLPDVVYYVEGGVLWGQGDFRYVIVNAKTIQVQPLNLSPFKNKMTLTDMGGTHHPSSFLEWENGRYYWKMFCRCIVDRLEYRLRIHLFSQSSLLEDLRLLYARVRKLTEQFV